MRKQLKHRIVAEFPRNWPRDTADASERPLVSQLFEAGIEHNSERGYRLESWQYSTVFVPAGNGAGPGMVDTIIAVFVK